MSKRSISIVVAALTFAVAAPVASADYSKIGVRPNESMRPGEASHPCGKSWSIGYSVRPRTSASWNRIGY